MNWLWRAPCLLRTPDFDFECARIILAHNLSQPPGSTRFKTEVAKRTKGIRNGHQHQRHLVDSACLTKLMMNNTAALHRCIQISRPLLESQFIHELLIQSNPIFGGSVANVALWHVGPDSGLSRAGASMLAHSPAPATKAGVAGIGEDINHHGVLTKVHSVR